MLVGFICLYRQFYTGDQMLFTPVNKELEVSGSWAKYRGIDVLIARDNNTRHKRVFAQLIKPYKDQIDDGSLDNDTSEELIVAAMSETILLDWKNAPGDVAFSKKDAYDVLLKDTDFRNFVEKYSKNLNNYLNKDEEKTLGE